MNRSQLPSGWKDKALFTPGPLPTSRTVKQAMLRDLGSRDSEFIEIVEDIRRRLLALAGTARGDYEAILMQGSGTFCLEAVVASTIPITSFCYPTHPNFDFDVFYQRLNGNGYVIYPGKVSGADCFRIGSIGRIDPTDVRGLLAAIGEALTEMAIVLS